MDPKSAPKSPVAAALQEAMRELVLGAVRAKRDVIVEAINRKVDLPVIGEGIEARLYGAVLDAAIEALDEVL